MIAALVALVVASSAPESTAPTTQYRIPNNSPVIVLDPGHPSENGIGTRGKHITEVRAVWEVTLKLKHFLIQDGYTVVLTKTKENQKVTNRKRAAIANESNADLMLRLHCDAGAGSGFWTYHPTKQGKAHGVTGPSKGVIAASTKAAKAFHPAFAKLLSGKLKDNGRHSDTKTNIGSKQGALTGSIFSEVPVLLIEMCVLQNAKDEAFIRTRDGQLLMAKALAAGVRAAAPRSQD